jgi:murein DD-endopeptidase MepM/ murein hydrolase activator NlpD
MLTHFQTFAEFEVFESPRFDIRYGYIKLTPEGILATEHTTETNRFNGLYFDKTGNLEFLPVDFRYSFITSMSYDESHYYLTTYMGFNGTRGLYKIKKDFSKIESLGVGDSATSHYAWNDKVYIGNTTRGLYVVNKDGSNPRQLLGKNFNVYINDLKATKTHLYVLESGYIYKVDLNTETSKLFTPFLGAYSIETDENNLYVSNGNTLFTINSNDSIISEKFFSGRIYYLKKYLNYFLVLVLNNGNVEFWISNDHGKYFYKSKYFLKFNNFPINIEFSGTKNPNFYIQIYGKGIFKGKLDFDFAEPKIFKPPFDLKSENDLVDKITAFFDHRYPYLGNAEEPQEYVKTTLNYKGQELPEPYLYYSSHDGIDWGLPLKSNIYSVADGNASYFYQAGGLGHAIKVEHDNGYITIYGHLSDKNLISNSSKIVRVSQGQLIGQVGMSGNTSGPHLHFTTYKGLKNLQNKVDPFGWEGNFTDPWINLGTKSDYIWDFKNQENVVQKVPQNFDFFDYEYLTLISNPINSKVPLNIYIKPTPPIFDTKNYTYIPNTSYEVKTQNFINETLNFSNFGYITFKGFSSYKDEMNKSIWMFKDNKLTQVETSFNEKRGTLDSKSESNATFLVLQKKYQRITSKAAFSTRK